MVDAHCHLNDPAFSPGENEEVIVRAINGGVTVMICNGGGVATSRQALTLAEKYPEVLAAVGIHPEEEKELIELGREEVKKRLLNMSQNSRVVAIGEAGLDFWEITTPLEKQKQVEMFKINMELALETGLPLVVHNRQADLEIRELLGNFPGKVQLHCFVGSKEMLDWAIEKGYYISVGGVITFKKSEELRSLVKLIPEKLLLVETDSPYLAPEPVRGTRNEPVNVKIIMEVVARVRNTTQEEIARLTTRNASDLFRLPQTIQRHVIND